eukprot:scaffold245674_cov44-Prasinocladus_malaysianus.AAC.1
MLVAMAPVAPVWLRPILRNANMPLLGFLLAQILGMVKESSAMTRTTLAATRIESGIALNVMPQTAVVNFNSRIMPGDPFPSNLSSPALTNKTVLINPKTSN